MVFITGPGLRVGAGWGGGARRRGIKLNLRESKKKKKNGGRYSNGEITKKSQYEHNKQGRR